MIDFGAVEFRGVGDEGQFLGGTVMALDSGGDPV